MVSYGYYQIGQMNIHRRSLKKEKRECRIALLPLLQAESDVMTLHANARRLHAETAIMHGVRGWDYDDQSVYHTSRWVVPIPKA